MKGSSHLENVTMINLLHRLLHKQFFRLLKMRGKRLKPGRDRRFQNRKADVSTSEKVKSPHLMSSRYSKRKAFANAYTNGAACSFES